MFDIFARFAAEVMERDRARSQAVALERKIQRRRNKRSNWTGDRQTLSEIGTLIQYRHRGPCDTDDSEAYLRAAVPWLIIKAGGFDAEDLEQRVAEWTAGAVPRLGIGAIRTCIAEARGRNTRKRLWWSAQELGDLLRLSVTERERLRLTRIRPAGMTRQQFDKYQRKREAELAKARRVAKGARPREQSKAQLKPWDALGMSRAKFYRMQKAGTLPAQIRDHETNSSAAGTQQVRSTYSPGWASLTLQNRPLWVQRGRPARTVASALTGIRPGTSRRSFVPLNRFRHRYRRGEVSGTPTSLRRR
jgi:hypothetical protein